MYNQKEIEKFNAQAHYWWDHEHGPFCMLHRVNPIRMQYILKHATLLNKPVLDLGCGGGILTESIYKEGAETTGIDLAEESIEIAKRHAADQHYNIDYQCVDIITKVKEYSKRFAVITCMEMLEHVSDIQSIVNAISELLSDDGIAFFSTLNRTVMSYLQAIIGAEYIMSLLPKGTHNYNHFIKPSELSTILINANLEIIDITGINYHPLNKSFSYNSKVDVNYMIACSKII